MAENALRGEHASVKAGAGAPIMADDDKAVETERVGEDERVVGFSGSRRATTASQPLTAYGKPCSSSTGRPVRGPNSRKLKVMPEVCRVR